MDLYEYQGKQLFRDFGIPVSDGKPASTPAEAAHAATELGCPVVVKAQVLTGGRGKAGGIKLAKSPAEAKKKYNDVGRQLEQQPPQPPPEVLKMQAEQQMAQAELAIELELVRM